MKRAWRGILVGGLGISLAAGICGVSRAEDAPEGGKAKGRAAGEKFLERRFSRMDKNGDGVLTQEEFPRPEMFEAADADKNGRVTMEEAKNAIRSRVKDHVQGAARQAVASRLKQIDTDGDGKISKAEFDATFARLDKDGDGFLTADEMKGAFGGPGRGGRKIETKKSEEKGSER